MIVRVVFQPPPDAIWRAELETTVGVALSEILSKDALPLPPLVKRIPSLCPSSGELSLVEA